MGNLLKHNVISQITRVPSSLCFIKSAGKSFLSIHIGRVVWYFVFRPASQEERTNGSLSRVPGNDNQQIFVGNLPQHLDDQELISFFERELLETIIFRSCTHYFVAYYKMFG